MAVFFDKVSRFYHIDLDIPQRATSDSAGYDFQVAEDIVVPPFDFHRSKIQEQVFESGFHDDYFGFVKPFTLAEMADVTKNLKARPTLVSTGMKCHLDKGQYLELTVRSSTPLKHWLIMANGIGIVDADYYNNSSNEGHIMFPLINLSPFAIQLKRGDKIGQGIIKTYLTIDNDSAGGERNGGFGSTNE
jgi:dUTP pyrophosphatase